MQQFENVNLRAIVMKEVPIIIEKYGERTFTLADNNPNKI